MAWIHLVLAGAFAIAFTTCMKFDGWAALLLFIVFATLSFHALTKAMKTLPSGTCYAVFTAIGAVGAAVVGIAFFGEPTTPLRLFLMALIVAVVIGLKLTSKVAPDERPN